MSNEHRLTTARTVNPGEIVTVFGLKLFRYPFIEGTATIVEASKAMPGLYKVRFEGEESLQTRFVFGGDWQSEPDAMLEALLAFWRATVSPEVLTEFDPADGMEDHGTTQKEVGHGQS